MDACPLLITSIVAVKPEDQGTFFQDFLGLSGYLCSIGGFYSNTALLRTRNAQNHNEAQRPALPAWGGSVDPPSKRDSAKARNMLKKRADSHHHGLGALPRVGCTLHAVLGRGLGSVCQKVCCHSITGSNMSSVCWIAIIQAPSKCIQIASVME